MVRAVQLECDEGRLFPVGGAEKRKPRGGVKARLLPLWKGRKILSLTCGQCELHFAYLRCELVK